MTTQENTQNNPSFKSVVRDMLVEAIDQKGTGLMREGTIKLKEGMEIEFEVEVRIKEVRTG